MVEHSTYATGGHEPRYVEVLPFQKNGTLRMAFGISHVGGRSIRITDFGYGPDATDYVTVLDPAGVQVGPQCCGNPLNKLRTFRPFTMEPGDNPLIAFNYDFVCQRYFKPGSSQITDTFTVRFETLGSSRWVTLPLPWRLVAQAPEKGECSLSESTYTEAS